MKLSFRMIALFLTVQEHLYRPGVMSTLLYKPSLHIPLVQVSLLGENQLKRKNSANDSDSLLYIGIMVTVHMN